MHKDILFLERVTADDYLFTGPDGATSDRKEEMDSVKSGALVLTSLEFPEMKVRVYGSTAVANGKATIKGKAGETDISGDYRFTDVFVKSGGQWKCVSAQLTAIVNR